MPSSDDLIEAKVNIEIREYNERWYISIRGLILIIRIRVQYNTAIFLSDRITESTETFMRSAVERLVFAQLSDQTPNMDRA